MKFTTTITENTNNLILAFIANEKRKKYLPIQFLKALPIKKKDLRTFYTHGNSRKKTMTSLKII